MIRRVLCWLGGHDIWLFATLTGRVRKCNAAAVLCRMNDMDPERAVVPAAAIRAALTATEES